MTRPTEEQVMRDLAALNAWQSEMPSSSSSTRHMLEAPRTPPDDEWEMKEEGRVNSPSTESEHEEYDAEAERRHYERGNHGGGLDVNDEPLQATMGAADISQADLQHLRRFLDESLQTTMGDADMSQADGSHHDQWTEADWLPIGRRQPTIQQEITPPFKAGPPPRPPQALHTTPKNCSPTGPLQPPPGPPPPPWRTPQPRPGPPPRPPGPSPPPGRPANPKVQGMVIMPPARPMITWVYPDGSRLEPMPLAGQPPPAAPPPNMVPMAFARRPPPEAPPPKRISTRHNTPRGGTNVEYWTARARAKDEGRFDRFMAANPQPTRVTFVERP